MGKKITVSAFAKRKAAGEKIVMTTVYDAPVAAAAFDAGIDIMLMGDSMAMTVLGHATTLPCTMEQCLHHTAACRRGAPDAFIVFDMPFMSYQVSREEALRNAGRALQEAGADAVKLEGGAEYAGLIADMVRAGIPVMAHLGLLPQRIQTAGGYRVAGRTEAAAAQLMEDARKIQDAGAFSTVLECVPVELAAKITNMLEIPTIGIGSGPDCSGQVQVLNDLLGIFEFTPKHAKRYAEIGTLMRDALRRYASDVREGKFPGEENCFH